MMGNRVVFHDQLAWMVLAAVGLACSGAYAQAEATLLLSDPNAVMKTVLSSLNALELPAAGRGTAVMKAENSFGNLYDKQLIIDFAFKGNRSRADVFESDGEHRGSRIRATVCTNDTCIRALHQAYSIGRADKYRREVGWDFHPGTFFEVLGEKPLVKWLEYELATPRSPADRSVELDSNGILRLSIRAHVATQRQYDPKEYDVQATISFDTHKEYRPVLYERKFINADGSWHATQAKLQWARFGTTWYVSEFECNELPSNRRHTVGKIESFEPKAEVADGEFTLEGMGIIDGMYVDDRIKGVKYWYKSPPRFAADPEIPLEEADFVGQVRAKAGRDDIDSAAAGVFYLRDYQTGRLIGPIALTPGSLLPLLNKKNYIIADPAQSELTVRKCLLETAGCESRYFDMPAGEVVEAIHSMLKRQLGDKAPPVRADGVDALITMKIDNQEAAYDVLCNVAAYAQARIFVEDGAVVLSRKPLKELADKS